MGAGGGAGITPGLGETEREIVLPLGAGGTPLTAGGGVPRPRGKVGAPGDFWRHEPRFALLSGSSEENALLRDLTNSGLDGKPALPTGGVLMWQGVGEDIWAR